MQMKLAMSLVIPIMAILLALYVSCADNEDSTTCTTDKQCGSGRCVVAPVSGLQFCADLAPGCSSGERWASSAGDQLAGLCVAPADAGTPIDAGPTPMDAGVSDMQPGDGP
jgi:hypothetical protein